VINSATYKLPIFSAIFALALFGLSLSAFSSPVSAGCICLNYTGMPFCAQSIPACQNKAGNCMEECIWHKGDDKTVAPKKKK
jgi:hypothetical protein